MTSLDLKKTDASPKKTDAGPKKIDGSPKKTDASLKKIDASPKKIDVCPEKIDVCPEKIDVCPEKIDVCPKKIDSCPKNTDACPKNTDTCPKPSERVRRSAEPSETLRNRSPIQVRYAQAIARSGTVNSPSSAGGVGRAQVGEQLGQELPGRVPLGDSVVLSTRHSDTTNSTQRLDFTQVKATQFAHTEAGRDCFALHTPGPARAHSNRLDHVQAARCGATERSFRTGRTLTAILFNYARVALGLQSYRAPWNPLTDGLLLGLALAFAALVDAWVESREASYGRAKGTL